MAIQRSSSKEAKTRQEPLRNYILKKGGIVFTKGTICFVKYSTPLRERKSVFSAPNVFACGEQYERWLQPWPGC